MALTVSPSGDEKGMRCGDVVPNAVAAPATVSGESFVRSHWVLGPGKAMQGTDPRARRPAVSRGHTRRCRSGSTDIRLHRKAYQPEDGTLVRGDVPLTSHRGPRPCLPSVLYDHAAFCWRPPLSHLLSPSTCQLLWRSRPASRCLRWRSRRRNPASKPSHPAVTRQAHAARLRAGPPRQRPR